MGETRVDLLHLLEDLRDAYPGSLEETILTEVVANALDSGATSIRLQVNPVATTIAVVDDGAGMSRRELARYHDIATSGKRRGEGIGFAGVGIKLGLLASEEVLTETRRAGTQVATSWCLASRTKAPWRWVPPPGMVPSRGTAVRLTLSNALSPLLDAGFIEATIRRHFEPLLREGFGEILAGKYPQGVQFAVNGTVLAREQRTTSEALISFRVGRRRKPAACGFLIREPALLPEEHRGIAISTLGKVIRRGWDWLGLTPAAADRISGLIEVPALASCLTLNKADFLRTGDRGATYLAYRRAVQEQVGAQLEAWGDEPEPEAPRRRRVRPLERDLQTVLVDLAREFPLLAALVDRGPGGQRKLPLDERGGDGRGTTASGTIPGVGIPQPELGAPASPPVAEVVTTPKPRLHDEPPAPALPGGPGTLPDLDAPLRRRVRRPAHYRLAVDFESRPDEDALARLAESTVWINIAHPAYGRAVGSRSEGYHLAVSVGMALAPLAVAPAEAHAFISAFLARWGAATEVKRRR